MESEISKLYARIRVARPLTIDEAEEYSLLAAPVGTADPAFDVECQPSVTKRLEAYELLGHGIAV